MAEFNRVDDPESDKERASGEPLAGDLQPGAPALVGRGGRRLLSSTRSRPTWPATSPQAADQSWLAVAGGTLFFFLVLSAIVLRGSRTIDAQSPFAQRAGRGAFRPARAEPGAAAQGGARRARRSGPQ